MKLKRFNKDKALSKLGNKNNKKFKIGTIICSICLLLGAIIYFSFARFESTQTFHLIDGVVAEGSKDINIVAVYQGETKTNSIPAKGTGWAFSSVTCDNGTAEWDYNSWSLVVNTTTKTKCTLYFVQPTQTAVQFINAKASNDSSLIADGTTDNNLRYTGANPNNYVSYNNELWRIIGVMNNITNASGTSQSLLKIRRAESIGNYSWDSSSSTGNQNSGHGINQWGASDGYEGADLMRELNTDYLGNTYVGIDDKWYTESNNAKESMSTSTISSKAQNMIETVVWNLGSPNNNNGTYDSSWYGNTTPATSYTRERAATNGKTCTSGSGCTDTVTRTSTWTGKVGLIYPSDYGYSTSGGTTTNRATCLSTSMNSWGALGVSDCKDNSWIYNSSLNQWTLSPCASSSSSSFANAYLVFFVFKDGQVNAQYYHPVSQGRAVVPVVFLKSTVSITGGAGTSTDPYILGYTG